MESPQAQPIDTGPGDRADDHGIVSTLVPEFARALTSIRKVAEVRLPVWDERRPGKDTSEQENVELLPPDSDQHSHHSSSSSASLHASPAVSSSPDQPDPADNISLSSIELNSKDANSSSPEKGPSKDSAFRGKAHHDVKASFKAPSPRSARRREREYTQNEGLKLARQRYQQEKDARHQQVEESHESSKAGHREAPPVPLTLCQSKPASSIQNPPFPARKPVVKLPGQPSVMSHSIQSSVGGGISRGSSMPFSPGNGNYRRPISRPFNGRSYPSKSTSRYNAPDWTSWQELTVKIYGLPATSTTRDLYRCFSRQGNITGIELYENTRGVRDGKASVKFK